MTVSVIIPAYNQSSTLRAAVESALPQADEVIVVNDASTDGFADALRGLLAANEHLHVIHTQARAGVCYARNIGIIHAAHDLILPLDADDVLLADAVDAFRAAYEPGTFVYSGRVEVVIGGEIREVRPPPIQTITRKNVAGVTFLFSRADWKRAGQYDPAFNFGAEDYALMVALLETGVRPVCIDAATYTYTIRPDGRAARCRERWSLILDLLKAKYPRIMRGENEFLRPDPAARCAAAAGVV